jgi:hypothetical protein
MLKKFLIPLITVLVVFASLPAAVVLADKPFTSPHENPDEAPQIFSGISLLRYYSVSLDYVIQKDRAGSESNLEKAVFVNIPPEMENITADFTRYGMEFTGSLVELSELWDTQNVLISQYRLNEAIVIYNEIQNKLPVVREQLSRIGTAVIATGDYLKINAVSAENVLRLTYEEVMAKIQQLYRMLDLLSRPLLPESLPSDNPEHWIELLQPTEITLEANSTAAYVGDKVAIHGMLSASGEPLAFREIVLLLDGVDFLTLQTDVQGHYKGEFRLPYRYVPGALVQTIFYPQGDDAGVLLASISPVFQITVLYYEAQLTIVQPDPAYLGRETMVNGYLVYNEASLSILRQAGLYLDDIFLCDFPVETAFTLQYELSADIVTGKHNIAVSIPAIGRYAPVFADCILEITRTVPILELNMPRIVMIPGSFEISGRIYSELGPLNSAVVTLTLGKNEMQVNTNEDGSFSARIKMSMGFDLLGDQPITVNLQPQEPWNAPLSTTRNIFLINIINCSVILLVLIIFGLYLPRRLKKRLGISPGDKVGLSEPVLQVTVKAEQAGDSTDAARRDEPEPQEKTANPVIYWYRLTLKVVQNLTGLMLKPQRTLREYARDVSRVIGPASKHFMDLTFIVERMLYSKQRPSQHDIEKSQQLSQKLQEETKGENH